MAAEQGITLDEAKTAIAEVVNAEAEDQKITDLINSIIIQVDKDNTCSNPFTEDDENDVNKLKSELNTEIVKNLVKAIINGTEISN
jgi:hypothetical protein